jgi:levanbiose-producing levanase
MTDRVRERLTDRTGFLWAIAGAAVLVVAIAVAAASALLPSEGEAEPTASPTATEVADPVRPSLHITPERHWMNDPQRPFFAGGLWHAYYLYNADYPDGNGTDWYHVTSTDLVTWTDQGVAIEKYRNGLGDIQSGSAVIDTENTAGFGAGAIVALVTQQHDGVQRQSLYYSTDDGFTFTEYAGNPVMENPGVHDFRDPKVVWDGSQWVMALAEGNKIGFYTSADLIHWEYRSGFIRDDLGLLECPDLFQMSVDGDPGRMTWVLGASANGEQYGRTTGYAYWTGEWDGTEFRASAAEPRWLDDGADFYAAVTWSDDRGDRAAQLATRYAMGWVNNWAYARELPTDGWQGGAQSLVRTLTLVDAGDELRLRSAPLPDVDAQAEQSSTGDLAAERDATVITEGAPGAQRVRLVASERELDGGRLAVRIGDDNASATVVIDAGAGLVSVDRSTDAAAPGLPETYRAVRSAPFEWVVGVVSVDLILDGMTLEVFVNDGSASLTSVVFVGSSAMTLASEHQAVDLESLTIQRLSD